MKIFGFCLIGGIFADIFLHYPRGSNNKLNESKNNRANGDRLFDSQNNAAGGYNVADKFEEAATSEQDQHKAKYFQSGNVGKSKLMIEWWSQHGCGHMPGTSEKDDPNWINCQYILQYSCQKQSESTLRNGIDTTRPKYTAVSRDNTETYAEKVARKSGDEEEYPGSGRHESWEYYDACRQRNRNLGLFRATQNQKTDKGAARTRQNQGGNRRGYEFPEERDYFPYWHPNSWTDIAVLTSEPSVNCDYYETESQNRKGKHECVEFYAELDSQNQPIRKHRSIARSRSKCNEVGGIWTEFFNYHEIVPDIETVLDCQKKADEMGKVFDEEMIWGYPYLAGEDMHKVPVEKCLLMAPKVQCEKAPWQRANHLGNTLEGTLPRYEWTLPHFHFDDEPRECIFRIRYNISTNDYPDQFQKSTFETYENTQKIKNNPTVEVMDGINLAVALNTAQVGRTFQDRSHIFTLEKRPLSVPDDANLLNLGVRGRRGNIQQSFVALEYDFIPNNLEISEEDYVHIQWEGANTLANNQAGEGKDGTDRHNMVAVGAANWNIPEGKIEGDPDRPEIRGIFDDAKWVWSSLDVPLDENDDLKAQMASSGYFHCASKERCDVAPDAADITALNTKLNNAPASFHGNILKFTKGRYHYMCTRNNSFSNRAQKGVIIVH